MSMTYLKIFTNFYRSMERLKDAEKGRLFDCMLRYAETGEESELSGNESFIWPGVKERIDAQRETYEKICERNRNNAMSGSEKEQASRTQSHPVAPSRTQSLQVQVQVQEQVQEKNKKNKRNKIGRAGLSGELDQAINEFKQFRLKMKKPMTDKAVLMLISKLEKMAADDETKIAILERSIYKGWSDVYPLKDTVETVHDDVYGNLKKLYEENANG